VRSSSVSERELQYTDAMRCVAVIATVAACGFTPRAVGSDPGIDAIRAPIDAQTTTDAALVSQACTVTPSSTLAAAGSIGGGGGSSETALACGGSELPIGIQLDMSNMAIPNHGNEVVAVATHMRCGAIKRDASGAMMTVQAELVTQLGDQGSGDCSKYFPTTATSEVDCPNGAVIVGLDGNLPLDTLFNSLTITCASLSGATITTTTLTRPVDQTDATDHPQSAPCPPGSALAQLGLQGGCAQDELLPQCAALTCN